VILGHVYVRYAQDLGEAEGAKMKVIFNAVNDELVDAADLNLVVLDRTAKDREIGDGLCSFAILQMRNATARNSVDSLKRHRADAKHAEIRGTNHPSKPLESAARQFF
jgi:hypothetical protein